MDRIDPLNLTWLAIAFALIVINIADRILP